MVLVPNNGKSRDYSPTPTTIMFIDTIGLEKSRVLLKVQLDPGLTETLISSKALPRGLSLIPIQEVKIVAKATHHKYS